MTARGDRERGDAVATMDAPERYEQLIAFLDSNLPSPVDRQEGADGSVQFTGGEPAEVVVSLTDTSVLVSEFAGVWESAFTLRGAAAAGRRAEVAAPAGNRAVQRPERADQRRARGADVAVSDRAATARAAPRPSGCTATASARPAPISTAARSTSVSHQSQSSRSRQSQSNSASRASARCRRDSSASHRA